MAAQPEFKHPFTSNLSDIFSEEEKQAVGYVFDNLSPQFTPEQNASEYNREAFVEFFTESIYAYQFKEITTRSYRLIAIFANATNAFIARFVPTQTHPTTQTLQTNTLYSAYTEPMGK